MTNESIRSVEIERTSAGQYDVRNVRGGVIPMGSGDDERFTPVELLLAALGGCSGIDVDLVASRKTEPSRFVIRVRGTKVKTDEGENRLENLEIEFDLAFPEGPEGERARQVVPRVMRQSHDKLCTVTRTVEAGTPVATFERSASSS
jgi:putative redox protein